MRSKSNNSLKAMLLIQSLSLLTLLAFLKNCPKSLLAYLGLFPASFPMQDGVPLAFGVYFLENCCLILLLAFCLLWTLAGVFFILSLPAFSYTGKAGSHNITGIKENSEASLSFLLTLILPLATDWQNSHREMLFFVLLLIGIILLLWRTDLFYDNPVLTILGYHVYQFSFKQNEEFGTLPCIGISRKKIHVEPVIRHRVIDGEKRVLYIEEIKSCR